MPAPGTASLAAILPIKVSGRHYGDNLARLDMLFSSLLHFAAPDLLDELVGVYAAVLVLGDLAAVAQHDDAVGDLRDLGEAVADIDERHALSTQRAHCVEQCIRLSLSECGGRLVEDE